MSSSPPSHSLLPFLSLLLLHVFLIVGLPPLAVLTIKSSRCALFSCTWVCLSITCSLSSWEEKKKKKKKETEENNNRQKKKKERKNKKLRIRTRKKGWAEEVWYEKEKTTKRRKGHLLVERVLLGEELLLPLFVLSSTVYSHPRVWQWDTHREKEVWRRFCSVSCLNLRFRSHLRFYSHLFLLLRSLLIYLSRLPPVSSLCSVSLSWSISLLHPGGDDSDLLMLLNRVEQYK